MSAIRIAAPELPPYFAQRNLVELEGLLKSVRQRWSRLQERLDPAHLFGTANLEYLFALAGWEELQSAPHGSTGYAHPEEVRRLLLRSMAGRPARVDEWLFALHGARVEALRIEDAPGPLGCELPARFRATVRASRESRAAILRSLRVLLRADLALADTDVEWSNGSECTDGTDGTVHQRA